MTSDHPTAQDLRQAQARFSREARLRDFRTPRYHGQLIDWGRSDRPPLVFVHGMSDQPMSFIMVMAHLVERGYRCLAYPLPNGRGDGANLGMYRHPDYVRDLVRILDDLGLEQVDLVGSSFGTTISQRMLVNAPSRVRRCVLLNGFPRRPLMRIERGLARLARYWPWPMKDLILREQVMARLEAEQFAGCPTEIYRYMLDVSGVTPCRAAARRTLIIDKLDLRPLLGQIPHPVLMIGGNQDVIVPKVYEMELFQGLKNVRRIELSPCGHYPQYTMPGPVAQHIDEFLG